MMSLFACFRTTNYLLTQFVTLWKWIWEVVPPLDKPVNRYFLSDEHTFDETYTHVPENTVYIEEWVQDGDKKCVVYYEGEEILDKWFTSPWDCKPKCPWIWVGDKETEIDLTRTFNRFLVVGNTITIDLVLKLIQVTEKTDLVYIEAGTFKEHKFPGEGLTIEQDENAL